MIIMNLEKYRGWAIGTILASVILFSMYIISGV